MLSTKDKAFKNSQRTKCGVCFLECDLDSNGTVGRCDFYKNNGGVVLGPSSIMISEETEIAAPILGIYHAFQKERFAAVGSYSCNLKCIHCINFSYSYFSGETNRSSKYCLDIDGFEQYLELLKTKGYHGVVFSFSEWTIYGMLFGEMARLAKKANLIVILCTNGMFNEETMNTFIDWVDVIRIDFKGLGSDGFLNVTGIDGYKHVEKMFKKLKRRMRINGRTWLEVSFCPVFGLNDNEIEIRDFARMVTDADETAPPMRLLRFIPAAKTGHLGIGSDADLDKCERILKEEGLSFVYKEKDIDEDRIPTVCPACGEVLISRSPGYFEGSCACAGCGSDWLHYFHSSVSDALN